MHMLRQPWSLVLVPGKWGQALTCSPKPGTVPVALNGEHVTPWVPLSYKEEPTVDCRPGGSAGCSAQWESPPQSYALLESR